MVFRDEARPFATGPASQPGSLDSRNQLAEGRDSNRSTGGNKMNSGTENEIAGKVHEVKGKIKEKVGQLTDDPRLEGEGIGEKLAGKVQNKIGQVQKVVERP
jgi:uncharacterized protein YjbJ (UPF0337 family)